MPPPAEKKMQGGDSDASDTMVEMLKQRLRELELNLEREAAGREMELTMLRAEYTSTIDCQRQTIEELQVKLSNWQTKDAGRIIMESEVKLLRERVINANEEVSTISRQSEDEIAGIRRRQFRIACQLEGQFRENIRGLRSKIHEELTSSLEKKSKDAIDTNELLQAELGQQNTMVFDLLSKYKQLEAERERSRLRASLACQERDVCAKHNVQLQHQLRKQQALLQSALQQVEELSEQVRAQDTKVETSPETSERNRAASKGACNPHRGPAQTRNQSHETASGGRESRHRKTNSGVPSKAQQGGTLLASKSTPALPPVKQTSATLPVPTSNNAGQSPSHNSGSGLVSTGAPLNDWLKAADNVIRTHLFDKEGGMLGSLGLKAPVGGTTEERRSEQESCKGRRRQGAHSEQKHTHTKGVGQDEAGQCADIWRAAESGQGGGARMPILSTNDWLG